MNMLKSLLVATLLAFSSLAFAAVDLNTATLAELDAVKNIGEARAKAIIQYREKNGGFKSVEDLNQIPGFKGKLFDKVKTEFTVGKTATAKAPVVGVININSADEKSLVTLPGIGEAKAKEIIAYRSKTPFKTVDDLANVKGFSKDSVNKIRANISTGN